MAGHCLLAYSPWANPSSGTTHVGRVLPHQPSNQENVPQTCPQANLMEAVFQLRFLLHRWIQLCQVGKTKIKNYQHRTFEGQIRNQDVLSRYRPEKGDLGHQDPSEAQHLSQWELAILCASAVTQCSQQLFPRVGSSYSTRPPSCIIPPPVRITFFRLFCHHFVSEDWEICALLEQQNLLKTENLGLAKPWNLNLCFSP